MTYTSPQSARTDGNTRSGRRGFVSGTTEARPGILTTEFWLSLIMTVTVIIAGYVSDAFNVDTAWALGAGIHRRVRREPRPRQVRVARRAIHGLNGR